MIGGGLRETRDGNRGGTERWHCGSVDRDGNAGSVIIIFGDLQWRLSKIRLKISGFPHGSARKKMVVRDCHASF